MRHPDLIGAVVIFFFGLLAIAAALTTPDPGFGVVGPGVLAAWLGGLVLLTAVWLGATALRATGRPDVATVEMRPLLFSFIAIAVYFALFVRLGFMLTSAAYLIVECRILGSSRHRRDAIAAVLFVAAMYVVFVRFLGVQLPRGILPF
ncbi:MAG TPA: tripartite tricarboxylate transporter TctB family protein [Candidatus Limnocylindria bacterium]|nr:tripartite tricarboxylate transporter TctB family protein [Candidatus Limnocylindria bacterium]